MKNNGKSRDHNFDQVCRQTARSLINKYNWTLLSETELAALIPPSPETRLSPNELEKKIKHQYTIAHYQACFQSKDAARREQGYRELYRYLFRVAYNRWPDIAEDVAQRALILIYQQIAQCQNPGTFLAFALHKLRHASQKEWRANGKKTPPQTAAPDQTFQNNLLPALQLDSRECSQMLVEAVDRLPDRRQKRIILGKYFEGMTDEEVSRQLEISNGHLRVLRHRAIKRLQQDKQLRHYFDAPV